MRVTFNQFDEDYIGSYIQELRKVGLLKTTSVSESMSIRKSEDMKLISDTLFIKILYERVLDAEKQIKEYKERFNTDGYIGDSHNDSKLLNENDQTIVLFNRFLKRINRSHYIEKNIYDRIINIVTIGKNNKNKKDFYYYLNKRDLTDLTNAFCLMVAYAKKYCFKAQVENVEKLHTVINPRERDRINLFLSKIAAGKGIDLKSVKIKYNEIPEEHTDIEKSDVNSVNPKHNNDKGVTIQSPILLKMMIYEFARRFFRFVEGEKDTATFSQDKKDSIIEQGVDLVNVDLLNNIDTAEIDEEVELWEVKINSQFYTKGGRNYDVDKFNKIALVNIYMYYIEYMNVFKRKTPKKYKYLLLCRLLVLAGLDEYEMNRSTFNTDAEHYAHEIQITLRTNQKKKTKPK